MARGKSRKRKFVVMIGGTEENAAAFLRLPTERDLGQAASFGRALGPLAQPVFASETWTTLSRATKFKTVDDAVAAALIYDGAVVRYNADNRTWSRLMANGSKVP